MKKIEELLVQRLRFLFRDADDTLHGVYISSIVY